MRPGKFKKGTRYRFHARYLLPLIIALALFAQGCLVGPDFKLPSAPVADKWLEQGNKSVNSTGSEHRDWWTVFNDPPLTRGRKVR